MSVTVAALVGDDVGDNRARVAAVQQLAGQCSDTVPFLLAPVRVETRFVQLERDVTGPSVARRLDDVLSLAATTAETLASTAYATELPAGTPRRKAFKKTVERPIVTAAQERLAALTATLDDAATLLHTAIDSTADERARVLASVARLSAALAKARSAIGTLRSDFWRSDLLAGLDAVGAQAAPVLDAAAALPTDEIVTALAPADGAGRHRPRVSRRRMAATSRAHADLTATLATAHETLSAIEAEPDAATRQLRLEAAAPALAADLDAAASHAAAIAVLPPQWHTAARDAADTAVNRIGRLVGASFPAAATAALAERAARLRDEVGNVAVGTAVPATAATAAAELVDALRVRIFPDDLAILTHESGLTAVELEAGTGFWAAVAAGGGGEPARRSAWRALVAGFGSTRAAWIVRACTPARPPADPDDAVKALATLGKRLGRGRPARPEALARALAAAVATIEKLPPLAPAAREHLATLIAELEPRLRDAGLPAADVERLRAALDRPAADAKPEPAVAPEDRAAAWTRQPTAALLPRCFVVVTVSAGVVTHVVAGRDVPADLAVGLDPADGAPDGEMAVDDDGAVQVGPGLRWLVDYDAAEAAGMAVTVPISVAEAAAGFDRVYVIGLGGPDADAGARRVAELFDNHHYAASGLALLPVGSATNSTTGRPSAYRGDDDAERSYPVELGAALAAAGTDGARVAAALGLPTSTVDHLEAADGHDIGDAANANAALWPATAGYALEELLGTVVGLDARDRLRRFAVPNVLGRGALPSLRVGAQPYGLLVASAYTRYVPDGGPALPAGDPATLTEPERQQRFELLLRDALLIMHADWTALRRVHVRHAYSTAGGQAQVLDVLGLDSGSARYDQRFAVNAGRKGLGIGPLQLHIGLPGATPEPAANAGAFALLQHFQAVFTGAGRIAPGPLLTQGRISPQYAPLYDRLSSTRGYEVRYVDQAVPLGGATSTDATPARVAALLATSLFDLVNDAARADQHDQALAELLLRQALLVQARDTALRILQFEGALTEDLRNRVGAGDLFRVVTLAGPQDVTRWSFLLGRLSRLSGAVGPVFPSGAGSLVGYLTTGSERRMHDYLDHRGANAVFTGFGNRAAHQPFVDQLAAHATAVGALGTLPGERIAELTREHLDVCAYRLDAWLLGLGVARLARMRAATPAGLHVGAFGWLDDLRPDADPPAPASGVPPILAQDPGARIVTDPASGGFVHAPSLAHASTAAILRAGYRAHHSDDDAQNRMAVNLSSARVQRALVVADGVTAGNDLGTLLGYQFERDLHDAYEAGGIVLDDLIEPLRAAFPSAVGVDGAAAPNAARHVVDGLRLLSTVRSWLASRGAAEPTTLFPVLRSGTYAYYPYGLIGAGGASLLPATSEPARLDAVLHAIDRLADTLDALGDLYTVEGVHQLVEGNQVRAAAVLSALGEGRVPPQVEVIDTPVEGTRVTNRVLLHLPVTDELPPGWTVPTPRATAEPTLNHWLGTLIGPPGRTRARVVRAGGAAGVDVNLTALGLQPIDLLAILENGLEDGFTELAARFVDTQRPLDVRDDDPAPDLQLLLERDPAWPEDVCSLAETAALLESIGTVVRTGRAASATDYTLTDTQAATGTTPDAAEVDARRDTALGALRDLGVRLLRLLSDGAVGDPAVLSGDVAAWIAEQAGTYRGTPPPAGPLPGLDRLWVRRDDVHDALLAALGFGIGSGVPPTTWASRDQVARALLERAESTLLEIARRVTTAGTGTDGLRTIFTSTLPVLARFTITNGDEVGAAITATPVTEPAVAVSRWLAGAAPVRAGLQALATAGTLATAFDAPWPDGLPAQLPTVAGEPWLAESAPTGPGDRLSLVLLAPQQCHTDGTPVVALLVDEFTELIPATHATTGVTFHYDQPDATAPQTMLLAVPPQLRGHWTLEDLVQTLDDTLELALDRAVEPVHLQDAVYGQLLPAVIGDIPPYGPGGGVSDHRVVLDFGTVQPAGGGD